MQFQSALLGLFEQIEAEAKLLPLDVSSSNILVVTTTEGFRIKLADFRWMAALQEPRSAVQSPYGVLSAASLAGESLLCWQALPGCMSIAPVSTSVTGIYTGSGYRADTKRV